MLISEVSDKDLFIICEQMRSEDAELFQVFLDRHPDIRIRYERYKPENT